MFLQLNHQKLEVYRVTRKFVLESYKLTKTFPAEERFVLISQIRRAALSVQLNVAGGSSKKSVIERKRFYEIARGSVIEVEAAFDIAANFKYFKKENFKELKKLTISSFRLLSGMINS